MAVGVDHRHYRFLRTVSVVEVKTGLGHFSGHQRVNDNQPGVAFDDCHVGQVEAANLIDPFGDLEQAVVEVQL
ncbi:hypothetical protein D3C77_329890 [compost metagenome]